MIRKSILRKLLYIITLFTLGIYSQELPPIQNFYTKDYKGENQNWGISQSSDKLIYVANSKGLLEYNGASWKLYPSPNETIMRSVEVVANRIYTGCFMEFGYWEKNNLGTLNYISLSKGMNLDLVEDEEFWNIINVDDYMVFQSLRRIYIYNFNEDTVSTIDSNSTITKMYKVDESIYFQRMGEGIFKIEAGKDFLLFDDEIVRNDEVIDVFGSENDLILLTKHNGFYHVKNGLLVSSDIFPNGFLKNFSLYSGIQLDDDSFALATISNGLIHLSSNGELIYQIDQSNGLSNSTVLAVYEDVDYNVWLGLDNGVSYVNMKSPYKVFNDDKGVLGSVYASAIFEGNLYLGTNQGLFYKSLKADDNFRFISGTQGQVWCLEVVGGNLFCGHHNGTFLVKGQQVQKVSNIQGTWNIAELANKPNLFLQGNYDGLYILENSGSSWSLRNKIKGFNNSSRYFETLGNEIFVNHEYNGVFKLSVDDSFSNVENVVIDTLIKGSNSGIVKYNEDLLYSYKEGIFKYDSTSHAFRKDSILSNVYDDEEYESGKLIVDENDAKLWIFTKSNISFVAPVGLTNSLKIKNIPITKELRDGILGYENIIRLDGDSKYLIGKTSGYLTVDVDEIEPNAFEVYLSTLVSFPKKTNEILLEKNTVGDLKNYENNFEFSFYAPEYNKYLKTEYQYRLRGIYDDWSNWSENANVFYENLPFGDYTFDVRAKIGNTLSGNTASYSFEISKPWYISNTMIALYILGVLLFSFFMHNVYRRYYRKQQKELIKKNKRELELGQVQNEKEIIKIRNEQLEIEFKSKSKELAASTMSIIRKNELLTAIKEELNTVNDKNIVKSVIKIIDKNLKQNNDWELFQEAFNNADSGFLKKVKTLHPSLSPNDLKLCAYLRLNLSSKEIAQLLNISPRSVEIKRYRLRKKLDLKHEDNLVNYILEL